MPRARQIWPWRIQGQCRHGRDQRALASPRSDATLTAFTPTQPGNVKITLEGLTTATELAGTIFRRSPLAIR